MIIMRKLVKAQKNSAGNLMAGRWVGGVVISCSTVYLSGM